MGRSNCGQSGKCSCKLKYLTHCSLNLLAYFQIGPYFLPPRVNGIIYADFLQNNLPVLLEDVPLRARENMIFQHDGAPAHYSRRVREFLNRRFRDKWMGRGGPIIWPARSPDLNVLDYFVWGYIKA